MAMNRPRRNPLAFLRHFPTEPQSYLMALGIAMFAAYAVINFTRMLDFPDLDWTEIPVGAYTVDKEAAGGPYTIYASARARDFMRDAPETGETLSLYAYGYPTEYRDTLTAWTLAHGGAVLVSDEGSYRTELRLALPQPALDRLEALVDDDAALVQWISDTRTVQQIGASAPLVSRAVSVGNGRNKADLREKAMLFGGLALFLFVTMSFLFRHERRNYRAGDAIRRGRIWA